MTATTRTPQSATSKSPIWELVPEQYCTPDGLIAFYESLPKGSGLRKIMTLRARNVMDSYLRHVVAKESQPTTTRVIRRRAPSERQQKRIEVLQDMLQRGNVDDIMTRLRYEAEIIAAHERQFGPTIKELSNVDLDAITNEFYLIAKFYLYHHSWSPQALLNVGVSRTALTKAGFTL
jgi:hypothetical protein